MQVFFSNVFRHVAEKLPLRTKETAEQCPALRVAVTLAERRNPSCEVLKRCLAHDHYLPTCDEDICHIQYFAMK